MSILNDKFDKVFVISSHPTYNRLNNINRIFQEFDISYELIISPDKRYFDDYSLIDKKNIWVGSGNKSLISANESILLKSKIEKYKSICVFEDDVFFEKNHLKMLSDFFKELNDDWQILNLGYQDVQNIIIHTLIDITIATEFADRIVNIYRKDTLCTPEYINRYTYEFTIFPPLDKSIP